MHHHKKIMHPSGRSRSRLLLHGGCLAAAALFGSAELLAAEPPDASAPPPNARAPKPERAKLADAELEVTRAVHASDCPSAAELAKATLALGSPGATQGDPLRVKVRFDRDANGYSALLEASGRKRGVRQLQAGGTTCRTLADAVSVVLAVLTDLAPPEETDHPGRPRPERRARTPTPTRDFIIPQSTRRFAVALGVESGLAYGLIGAAATGTAHGALRLRYASAELELGAFASTPHFESFTPGVLEMNLSGGLVNGCAWLGAADKTGLGACGGLGLGSLSGSGHGFDHDDTAKNLWISVVAGLVGRVRLGPRWACRLALSAVVPLRSQSFVVDPLGGGFGSAPAAVLLRFGPEYRFW